MTDNSALPPGATSVGKKPAPVEMRAFDALPRPLRDALNYAVLDWSAFHILRELRVVSPAAMLACVRADNQRDARLCRRQTGLE